MGVNDTVTLAISTPGRDADNYYNAFLEIPSAEDPSEKMFRIITLGLACDECVAKGEGEKCPHKMHMIPPWKSQSRMKKTKLLMRGFADDYLRENMGMRVDSTYYYFRAPFVSALSRSNYGWTSKPRAVYIGIDPSGGGDASNYAIASVASCGTAGMVVVGLDHTPSADSKTVMQVLRDHVMALRNHPTYRHSTFVVYIEANMSFIETDRVRLLLSEPQFQPLLVPSKDDTNKGRVGIWTTPHNKEAMVHYLQSLLVEHRLQYSSDLVSVCSQREDVRMQLENQMRAFKRCERVNHAPEHNATKVSMSGKTAMTKDDLVMALMFALYFRTESLNGHGALEKATSGVVLD